jgi:S-adenosylmethionine hydrolase
MISLTTDFDDYYVGQMKGAIYKINPNATVVDITHKIKKQSIYEAAYVIATSYEYFPKNTVHVVIVDPGVGSKRDSIIIEKNDYIFVGPDNGVFSLIDGNVYRIDTNKLIQKYSKYGFKAISNTFHGRDLFAPAAAFIDLGDRDFFQKKELKIDLPFTKEISSNEISVSVLYVDSFGNIILNIKEKDAKITQLELLNNQIPVLNYYEEGKACTLMALYSSSGHLEISKYLGSANSILNLTPET